MVGLRLPLVPMKHAYVLSESIPRTRGLPNVRDHDGSVYFRVQGDCLMMGGYENNPILLDEVLLAAWVNSVKESKFLSFSFFFIVRM